MRHAATIVVCGLLLVAGVARADPFADFRIPPHVNWRGITSLDAGAWWDDGSGYEEVSQRERLNANLYLAVDMDRDSDALQYGFHVDSRLAGERYDDERTHSDPPDFQHSDGRDETLQESISLGAGVRAYPWTVPLGLQVTSTARGAFFQRWSNGTTTLSGGRFLTVDRREADRIVETHDNDQGASGRLTVGYGRVRDATVVYAVHVLEDRLRATGAISQPLPLATQEKLAALFFLSSDYASVLERSDRFFWRDVEMILNEAGLLANGVLDAYSVLRAKESIAPYGDVTRWRGWFVGPVLEFSHQHQTRHRDDYLQERDFESDSLVARRTRQNSESTSYNSDQVYAGGSFEYHRPLGWNWQIDLSSRVMAPVRPDEQGLKARNDAGVRWLVADRWRASLFFRHSRTLFEPRYSDEYVEDDWGVDSEAMIAYYIEDRTQLSARVSHQQYSDSIQDYPDRYNRSTSITLGFSYRFLGRLDAPGLVNPLRLSH